MVIFAGMRIGLSSLLLALLPLSVALVGDVERGQGAAPALPASTRPNVVLIMMDDLGYGDLGSYGAPDIRTPNVDRLARQGVRFTDAYANAAVCSPTRAALMTGRYQQRVGLEWALGPSGPDTARGLPVSAASLPQLLRQRGYRTGLVGKWHLGTKPEIGPNAHGFDEFFGSLGGAVDYYSHEDAMRRPDLFQDLTPVQVRGYLTDEITRRAVAFVNRHAGEPFFLDVAYTAPHWPFQPPDESPDGERSPRRRELYELPGDPDAPSRADYVRMVERADQGIGDILEALERRGLTSTTLVIFTSDNGGEWLSRNVPFFERKSTLWEGGIRVPMLLRWPGVLRAGATSRQVAITMDLTASVLAATGTTPATEFPLDGIDLLPVIRGQRPIVSRDLFWRIAQPSRSQRAVRTGQWKLLIDGAGVQDGVHVMLFNLESDPGERLDLAAKYPERVADLRARIAAWERAVSQRFDQAERLQ